MSPGWHVYLLRCSDGTLYCGITNDLERRLGRHGRGDVKYTRGRLPVQMVWSEPARDRGQALRREAELKRLPRTAKLRLLHAGRSESDDLLPVAAIATKRHEEADPRRAPRRRLWRP